MPQAPTGRRAGDPGVEGIHHRSRDVCGHTRRARQQDRLRLVDWNGTAKSADKVVKARLTGAVAVLKNGTLTWAYAPVTPSCTTALTGASPTTTSLSIARLTP